MRIYLAKRIFMNEADSSPGNGAQPVAAAPAEPTAAPTAPTLDVDALVSRFTSVMDEKLAAHKNSTFAELRKAGAFKQDKPSEPTPTSQPTTSAPVVAQAGLTHADVEALLERENIIATRAAKHGLNDAQARRLKSALSGVSRESFASEADSYLTDMGLVKAPTPPQPATPAQATAAPAPTKPNISDRGTAAPTDMRDSEGVINSRPLEATAHDYDELRIKYGETKALQMWNERVNNALKSIRIKSPSSGR